MNINTKKTLEFLILNQDKIQLKFNYTKYGMDKIRYIAANNISFTQYNKTDFAVIKENMQHIYTV